MQRPPTLTCTRSDVLAAGGSYPAITLTVNVAVQAGASVTNTATVSSGDETNTANDTASDPTTITPVARRIVTGAGPGGGPYVRVFDGVTGREVRGFFAYAPTFIGGVDVALGDVNGDGVPDVITGAGPGGGPRVRVFDGQTGAELASFFAYNPLFLGGVHVAAGDVDGDGVPEIITGAGPGGGPHVRVVPADTTGPPSGALVDLFAYDVAFTGGVFVAAGDVDGDGVPEIITGAGPGGGPHVRVWKLVNGAPTELFGFYAFDPAFTGGVRVAAGNVDGSDRASIIVGAGPGGGPQVRVLKWTGAALHELASFFAYDAGFLGGVYVGAAEVNGDGRADVITGAGPGGGPHVKVFSGADGSLLMSFFAYSPTFTGGVQVGGFPR